MEILSNNESPKNLIGKKVREFRLKNGMSQMLLAAKLRENGMNVPWASVCRIEAQLRKVTDVELVILAKVLNVSIEAFFR